MSLNPQAPKKPDDFAFALLSFPFNTLEAIGSRIVSAFTSTSRQPPKEIKPLPIGDSSSLVVAKQPLMIADRVHRLEVSGRNVSFFQYHEAKIIRINCRELRHLKPIDFTPAIADSLGLVYDIDGAIQWVRQNGLESNATKQVAFKTPSRPSKSPVDEVREDAANSKVVAPAPSRAALNIVRATGNKSTPFTGKIISFGITQIKAEGRKPYSTYAMTLRSETGSYEKQFIGEHLADLVTDLELHEGQLVRLQLVGKNYFEVEVNGKMEERSRNHYAIETL